MVALVTVHKHVLTCPTSCVRLTAGPSLDGLPVTSPPGGQWVRLPQPQALFSPSVLLAVRCVFWVEVGPPVALAKPAPVGLKEAQHLKAENGPVQFHPQYRKEFRPKNGGRK